MKSFLRDRKRIEIDERIPQENRTEYKSEDYSRWGKKFFLSKSRLGGVRQILVHETTNNKSRERKEKGNEKQTAQEVAMRY